MRSSAPDIRYELREVLVLLAIDQNQFDEGIRLLENGSDRPMNFLARSIHRHKDRDNAVRARPATGEKPGTAGKSKPGREEDEQGREGCQPTNEQKGELKHRPHTFLLIYL